MDPYLQHHGVKGMKWGVRRYQNKDGSLTPRGKKRYGEDSEGVSVGDVTLRRHKSGALNKGLQKVSKHVREETAKTYNYDILDKSGKVVGNWQGYKKSPDEMNITWMDVKSKERGKGYATSAMTAGEIIAKKYGAKKITGEVVGQSPDMLHITDKKGYVRKGEIRTEEVLDTWGGLTLVEKNLK